MHFKQYVDDEPELDPERTTHTRFFDRPDRLEFIEQHLFSQWEAEADSGARPRRIRIWSAPATDGSDPYSLALTLLERFPASQGWRIQVLVIRDSSDAGDLGCPMVASKKSRTTGSELEPATEFHRVSLSVPIYPVGEPFDLIWCSNVLTCFQYYAAEGATNRALDLSSPPRERSKRLTH